MSVPTVSLVLHCLHLMRTPFTLFIVTLAVVREDEERRFSRESRLRFDGLGHGDLRFEPVPTVLRRLPRRVYEVIAGKRITDVATAAETLLVVHLLVP